MCDYSEINIDKQNEEGDVFGCAGINGIRLAYYFVQDRNILAITCVHNIITFMSKTQKKPTQPSQRSPQPQEMQILPKKKSTKTVQILIHNLDQQIQDSYRKLKQIKSKNIKKSQISYQGHSFSFSSSHHKKTVSDQQQTFESPFRRKATVQTHHRALLDNHQLMQYIHLVYQTYNLKDPLQGESFSTGKKTVQTHKEAGSPYTPHKPTISHYQQVGPFQNGEGAESVQRSRNKGKKIKLISSRLTNEDNQKKKAVDSNTSHKKRIKTEVLGSPIQQRFQGVKIQKKISHIPQTFRFCFMCEQPILESNLQWHQQTCLRLQQAIAHKTLAELITILDDKIRKFRKQIQLSIINKSEERVKEEFNQLQSTVKSWMEDLPPEEITQLTQHNRRNSYGYRHSFGRVEEVIGLSSWSSYESMRKLQWFCRLRESIGAKYFSN